MSLEANKTPVIIAAYQEQRLIRDTLSRLDTSLVDPIVVVNGEPDRTAEFARGFDGVTVLELEEQGKITALQAGIRFVRDKRHAGPDESVLFLDADSHPAFPKSWPNIMRRGLNRVSPKVPSVVVGPIGYFDGNTGANLIRTSRRYKDVIQARMSRQLGYICGANMGVKFGTEEVREQFLELPHVWPSEDIRITNLILASSEQENGFKMVDPRTLVLQSARYHDSLTRRILMGRDRAKAATDSHYRKRAAPTANRPK